MPTIGETLKKIEEFAQLQPGWHFGSGVAPSAFQRAKASLVLFFGRSIGLERANAFPGVDGQIEVRFYRQERMLEVTLETDGAWTIAIDNHGCQTFFEENVSISRVLNAIGQFVEDESIWASLDLFTEDIMTRSVRRSQVGHLIYTVASPSPWLTESALLKPAGQSVITLGSFTPDKLANRRSIGQYPRMASFPAIAVFSKGLDPLETGATTISTVGPETMRDVCLLH